MIFCDQDGTPFKQTALALKARRILRKTQQTVGIIYNPGIQATRERAQPVDVRHSRQTLAAGMNFAG
jgi:hypothetical protein